MKSAFLGESADGPTIPSVRQDGGVRRDCLLRDCAVELRHLFESGAEDVDVALLLEVELVLHELDVMEQMPAAPVAQPGLWRRMLLALGVQ